jgi:transglycosylase-like protein
MLRWILQAALVLALVFAPTAALARADTFSDDDGTVYEPAIEALADQEIIAGCDDQGTEYCPRQPVRRDQAAALLARAFELPAAQRDHFANDDDNPHEDAINQLAQAQISDGCAPKKDYCGAQVLRRDQMAALLVRAAGIRRKSQRYFRDVNGRNALAINTLAASGITAGCTRRSARFCPEQHVRRGELAMFLARALNLVPRAELAPLAKPRRRPQPKSQRSASTVWDRLAKCESGGNWSINTGNGYYGGLQFSLSSWRAVGGSGYPHEHSREQQIARGKRLRARQGWGAWPSCSNKLGLR